MCWLLSISVSSHYSCFWIHDVTSRSWYSTSGAAKKFYRAAQFKHCSNMPFSARYSSVCLVHLCSHPAFVFGPVSSFWLFLFHGFQLCPALWQSCLFFSSACPWISLQPSVRLPCLVHASLLHHCCLHLLPIARSGGIWIIGLFNDPVLCLPYLVPCFSTPFCLLRLVCFTVLLLLDCSLPFFWDVFSLIPAFLYLVFLIKASLFALSPASCSLILLSHSCQHPLWILQCIYLAFHSTKVPSVFSLLLHNSLHFNSKAFCYT